MYIYIYVQIYILFYNIKMVNMEFLYINLYQFIKFQLLEAFNHVFILSQYLSV